MCRRRGQFRRDLQHQKEKILFSVLNRTRLSIITEKQGHRLVQPPLEECNQRHTKEQKLDAQVDRARLREKIRRLWHRDRAAQEGTEEERDGDGGVGGEGHDWEEDDAERPMIRE